jgi:hypothetical protein
LYAEDEHPNKFLTGDFEILEALLAETLPPLQHSRDGDDFLPRRKRRKVGKEPTSVRMYESTFSFSKQFLNI